MSFALIDAKKVDIPIATACSVLDVSQSGYYAWKKRGSSLRQRRDLVLLAHIRSQFATSNGTYGSPRMHFELQEDGLCVGRHRVARLMRDNSLMARQKTRFKKTTDSDRRGGATLRVDVARLQSTFSIRTLAPMGQTKSGAWISRISGPPKAGCIWPSYWICSLGALSAGQ